MLLLDILRRYADLARATLWPPRDGIAPRGLRHYALTVPLLAGLPVLLAYHWLGLLLDELLFPGYRRVAVREPLFVLGVPRSGTTAVHRRLAADPGFTTFSTWECVFGVAITWRKLWRGAGRVDRAVGRPLGRLLDRVERRALGGLDAVHPVARTAPEEDYLALMPVLGCFILVVAFPDARFPWRLGRADERMGAAERDRLLAFHRRCVQRHLYCNGTRRRFLSKNASFAPLVGGLLRAYPDARVICCLREPAGAVSSQLASLHPSLEALHGRYRCPVFRDRMLEQLAFYYRNLLDRLGRGATRAVLVPAGALRDDLDGVLRDALARLGIERPRPLGAPEAGGGSGHAHALADFGLDEAAVERAMGDVRERFDWSATGPVPASVATAERR